MENKILIGSHVSLKSPDYYLGSVKEALSYNSSTFMFYTGAPQNSFRLPLERLKIEEGRELIKQSSLDESKIIVHAPYIINIANKLNEKLFEMSKDILLNEIKRVAGFNLKILVLHPGSHVGTGIENGLNSIVQALDDVFSKDDSDVKIALETMAGKGNEMGANFEQLAYIIKHVKDNHRLGVCFDTCHVNDEGLDVKNLDKTLEEFDRIIGLDRLLCIHINDSKNPLGSHKDRHENIGYGEIGFDCIYQYVHHPKLVNVPKILETPYVDGKAPYKQEIKMLLDGKYIPSWKDNL